MIQSDAARELPPSSPRLKSLAFFGLTLYSVRRARRSRRLHQLLIPSVRGGREDSGF